MRKTLSNFIRILLIFLIIAGVVMCIGWLPRAVEYAVGFLDNPMEREKTEISLHILCAVIAVPIFAVFGVSFVFPHAIEKDTLFSDKIAQLLKAIGLILIVDCVLFCAVFGGLLFLGEYILAPALIFVGALGITVGSMLLVLSKYVKRAAALKEEADYTL